MKENSKLMTFFRWLNLDSIAWSLRRLHCPVDKNCLVLEVGSGGNPYFRSNVLLDAYEETQERHWEPLVSDRVTVLGFVEKLPFKDKAFDFVIASHVLEHSPDPASFLSELQRVSKAGYIEVPDAFMERINPYPDHRLEITVRNGKLLIRKKDNWLLDSDLVELYEDRVKPVITQKTMRSNPFEFHVRYYWENRINFQIINPEVEIKWQPQVNSSVPFAPKNFQQKFRSQIINLMRRALSQKQRNKNINIASLLACPICNSTHLMVSTSSISCQDCGAEYPVVNQIPRMSPTSSH